MLTIGQFFAIILILNIKISIKNCLFFNKYMKIQYILSEMWHKWLHLSFIFGIKNKCIFIAVKKSLINECRWFNIIIFFFWSLSVYWLIITVYVLKYIGKWRHFVRDYLYKNFHKMTMFILIVKWFDLSSHSK